jgi:hypothetical protein
MFVKFFWGGGDLLSAPSQRLNKIGNLIMLCNSNVFYVRIDFYY